VIAGAPGCELMRDTGTWNHRGDSGLSLLVAVEEAGFKTAGTDLHCDNTGMTLELLEYCRRNNITEPPPERMESTDAGAVELQIGLTDNLVGHCSEIVAFSLPVTGWLKSRRGLDWTRNPAVQISKNSPLVGHKTIAAVVDAVTRAYAADHNNAVLTKGKHYRLFVVPAAGCHGYAIGRGHAHAFVRGEDFKAGVIARAWQESHGFFDDADAVAVAATTSVPSAGAGEAATTHLQEVGATATTGGSGGSAAAAAAAAAEGGGAGAAATTAASSDTVISFLEGIVKSPHFRAISHGAATGFFPFQWQVFANLAAQRCDNSGETTGMLYLEVMAKGEPVEALKFLATNHAFLKGSVQAVKVVSNTGSEIARATDILAAPEFGGLVATTSVSCVKMPGRMTNVMTPEEDFSSVLVCFHASALDPGPNGPGGVVSLLRHVLTTFGRTVYLLTDACGDALNDMVRF
jgi:hypothetical protein